MSSRPAASRLTVVTAVLLAIAVAVLLALLTRDFLAPGLAGRTPAPAAPSASPSAIAIPSDPAAPPAPTREEVMLAVDPLLDAAPGTARAQVRDATTGAVLYQRSATEPVAPASTLKILSAAAILRSLGAERTLTTQAVALPADNDGVTELVLVGGGDVLLGTGDSDPTRVDGRAGLDTLAERTVAGLRERGVTGPVRVTSDLRLFQDEDPVNPTWTEDLLTSGNISPIQPLATYGGRTSPGTGTDRVSDPADAAARTFQRRLAAAAEAAGADLTVDPEAEVGLTTAPRSAVVGADPVAQVASAPVGEQVEYLLTHSENQVTEALAHVAAGAAGGPATHAGAAELVRRTAEDLGVPADGMRIADASGLSTQDRMTQAQVAAVLEAALRDDALAPVVDGLPRPGEDSTLDDRFLGTAAEEAVAAKTGTLDGLVALAGTVRTESGGELVFSVGLDGIGWEFDTARDAVDDVVVALAGL